MRLIIPLRLEIPDSEGKLHRGSPVIRTHIFGSGEILTLSVGLVLFNCFTDDLAHLISDNLADVIL